MRPSFPPLGVSAASETPHGVTLYIPETVTDREKPNKLDKTLNWNALTQPERLPNTRDKNRNRNAFCLFSRICTTSIRNPTHINPKNNTLWTLHKMASPSSGSSRIPGNWYSFINPMKYKAIKNRPQTLLRSVRVSATFFRDTASSLHMNKAAFLRSPHLFNPPLKAFSQRFIK